MTDTVSLETIRNKNLCEILKVLRSNGACTLAHLTEHTDIGLTTVKKCISQAAEWGMVLEGDIAESTGGRKAKQYIINEKYQYFLFLIVDNNDLISKIYNFNFDEVESSSVHFEMSDCINSIYRLTKNSIEKYDIRTVCLSLPCIVKDGVIVDWYYNPSAKGLDIKSELENRFNINAIVQNDMNLSVIGESSTIGNDINNIITVQFGHNGIGMGEMVNGHLLEGKSGFAGEVSFVSDFRKNIMGTSFPAKIIRNAIIYLAPQIIVFYKSERQNDFERIFDTAIKDLPSYAIPKIKISDNYFQSIIDGFKILIDKKGYFKKGENRNG